MRKKIIVLLAAASLGLGTAAPVAFAGTNGGTAEGDGTDYGWIGLLGLAGSRDCSAASATTAATT